MDLAIRMRKDRGQVGPVERVKSGSQSTRDTGLWGSLQALAADLGHSGCDDLGQLAHVLRSPFSPSVKLG